MVRQETRRKADSRLALARHSEGMITTIPRRTRHGRVAPLARVDRTADRLPATGGARNLAYRRLAASILGLDVPTLAAELHSARVRGFEERAAA